MFSLKYQRKKKRYAFLGNTFYINYFLYVLSLVVSELYEAKHEGLVSLSLFIFISGHNKKDLDN